MCKLFERKKKRKNQKAEMLRNQSSNQPNTRMYHPTALAQKGNTET